MKALVTGGTGFIGLRLARLLRQRGDEVLALVRSTSRSAALEKLGCRLVEGSLLDSSLLRRTTEACDAVFHVAGVYRVGIPESERPAMYEANVTGTERVLDASSESGVKRIIYVSTINVFGNTRGRVVDETYDRPPGDYLSYYDETKFMAHQAAIERIDKGAPVTIVQPGVVYGRGDHSGLGDQIEQMRKGKLKFLAFPELGFNFVYVDDVAEGILLAHDRARIGESYVLGGQITTLGEVIGKVAELTGRKPPRVKIPAALIRLSAPFGPLLGPRMGMPSNLAELVKATDGVTYWASDAKARRELGYSPRGMDAGLTQLLAES